MTPAAGSRGFVKRLLRPLGRPFLIRFDDLRRRVELSSDEATRLGQHLPIVLNAIEAQNATAREFARARIAFEEQLEALAARLAEVETQLSTLGATGSARPEAAPDSHRETAPSSAVTTPDGLLSAPNA